MVIIYKERSEVASAIWPEADEGKRDPENAAFVISEFVLSFDISFSSNTSSYSRQITVNKPEAL